ncbi:MAG: hypothetical protein F7C35_01980 [Desulfurococcales archaeon]|nr:hypothetical protein [Desulfurococcales archaeon]
MSYLEGDDETLEAIPSWSGLLLALAARGVELDSGELLVFDDNWNPRPQSEPLIGSVWAGEVFIDTGSRSARSLSGVEEGFILKTSILLRYWSGSTLEERILYPLSSGAPGFLLVRGDDRKRQASLYVAELGMVLSILKGGLPVGLDGPLLVVRHGSLLQSLGTYFNKVFDLERRNAEAVLGYVGLDKATVKDIVDASTIRRELTERVNPGLMAAHILDMIKKISAREGHTVLGITEDVSVGRHLLVTTLARIAQSSVSSQGSPSFTIYNHIDRAIADLDASWREACLSDFDVENPRTIVYEGSRYLEAILQELAGAKDRYAAAKTLADLSAEEVVRRIYERQILKYFNLSSDSHLIMLYNYLFKPPGKEYRASIEVDKSWLYRERIIKSFRERIISDDREYHLDEDDIAGMVDGVSLRYILPEAAPSCPQLAVEARRLGIDRRVLADLIRVIPPLRVEYLRGDPKLVKALNHVYTQALVTAYGVPPQLLVVDARSRVHEWEYSALASLLEALSRRVTPYSTFIRDFSVRRLHLL